jgi:hypothetical protein
MMVSLDITLACVQSGIGMRERFDSTYEMQVSSGIRMVLFPIQIKKAEEQEREQSLNRITTYASITEKLLLLRQMFVLVVFYYPIKSIG